MSEGGAVGGDPAMSGGGSAGAREASTSIDELLRYEDETVAGAERGPIGLGLRWLLQTAGYTAVIMVLSRLTSVTVPIVLVAGGVLALLILRHLLRLVTRSRRPITNHLISEEDLRIDAYDGPPPDAMRAAVARWVRRLSLTLDDPSTFSERLRPELRELANERLRQRYGVTITGDPVRARAILGDALWTVLSRTYRRGPGMRELSAAVVALEDLKSEVDSSGLKAGVSTEGIR